MGQDDTHTDELTWVKQYAVDFHLRAYIFGYIFTLIFFNFQCYKQINVGQSFCYEDQIYIF